MSQPTQSYVRNGLLLALQAEAYRSLRLLNVPLDEALPRTRLAAGGR